MISPQRLVLLATAISISVYASSQRTDSITQKISSGYLDKVSAESGRIEKKIDQQSERALHQMQKQEARIKRKLARTDSLKAATIFGDIPQQYNRFQQRLQNIGSSRQYIPSLDTMTTSLKFLEQNPLFLSTAKNAEQKLGKATTNVKALESQFQKAEEIKQFLNERKQYLKNQLNKLGYARQLKQLNKQAYYYGQQIAEYKSMIAEPKKAEQKALEYLSKTKLFNEFMKKNSMFSSLFPGASAEQNTSGAQQAGFAGLQTRAQVTAYIQQAVLKTPGALPQIQKNLQNAQSQVDQLRNKLNSLGLSGGDDLDMPDFIPNSQRTKPLSKRLEYSINFQSQKTSRLFPVTSDIGFSIGYKLNDKSVFGVGGSYKIGWGSGWKNIKLTNEGIGIRSFIDWNLKGSFWLSGGYEQNYRTAFSKIEQLKNLSAWQQSGLVGISKTISMKSKLFRKTKFQLLWDFLSYRQVPLTTPILFRIGYTF